MARMNEGRDWAELVDIEIVAGLAEDAGPKYRGFLTIRATAEDGSFMTGQLAPAAVRKMALNFLGAAEAAVQDAIVMTILTDTVGLDQHAAGFVVNRMRGVRHVIDPDVDDR